MELNQMLQQLNQPETVIQDDNTLPQKTREILSTSKRVPSKQIDSSTFSITTHLSLHVITKIQKQLLLQILSLLLRIF